MRSIQATFYCNIESRLSPNASSMITIHLLVSHLVPAIILLPILSAATQLLAKPSQLHLRPLCRPILDKHTVSAAAVKLFVAEWSY